MHACEHIPFRSPRVLNFQTFFTFISDAVEEGHCPRTAGSIYARGRCARAPPTASRRRVSSRCSLSRRPLSCMTWRRRRSAPPRRGLLLPRRIAPGRRGCSLQCGSQGRSQHNSVRRDAPRTSLGLQLTRCTRDRTLVRIKKSLASSS